MNETLSMITELVEDTRHVSISVFSEANGSVSFIDDVTEFRVNVRMEDFDIVMTMWNKVKVIYGEARLSNMFANPNVAAEAIVSALNSVEIEVM